MPILIHKDGWNDLEQVLFVGPDTSGVFPVEEAIEVPKALDPLEIKEIAVFIGEVTADTTEQVELDYSLVAPENKEQLLRVTGVGLYRKKFYLSQMGDGSSLGQRPKPQPKEHEYEVVSFGRIRNPGEYRRERVYNKDSENGSPTREVVGWITQHEHFLRMGYERK